MINLRFMNMMRLQAMEVLVSDLLFRRRIFLSVGSFREAGANGRVFT